MELKDTLEKIKSGELTSVNLRNKDLNDEDAKHLSEALTSGNCKLTSLNLGWNNLTDEGAKQMAIALAYNLSPFSSRSTLRTLSKY